jgi:M6 family metalloprotease-like protein
LKKRYIIILLLFLIIGYLDRWDVRLLVAEVVDFFVVTEAEGEVIEPFRRELLERRRLEAEAFPSTAFLPVEYCRLENVYVNQTLMVGFPLSPYRIPTKGNVNVKVLVVDFPDVPGVMSEEELDAFFAEYEEGVSRFFDDQSFGQVEFRFSRHPGFVRIPERALDLSLTRTQQRRDLDYVVKESIRLVDPLVDFTEIDMVIVFLNPAITEELADVSPALVQNQGGIIQTNEGAIYNATLIAADGMRVGYPILAHEMGHLFGLMDLYKFTRFPSNSTLDVLRQYEYVGVFDFMNVASPNSFGDNRDMLGWTRFQLDWITEDQVRCVNPYVKGTTTHPLIPTHVNSDGAKMVVIPFNKSQALVLEVKAEHEYCVECRGGLYAYVVDSFFENGHGPIRLVRPAHSTEALFQDAYLMDGQVLRYENLIIEVLEQGDTSYIQITVD